MTRKKTAPVPKASEPEVAIPPDFTHDLSKGELLKAVDAMLAFAEGRTAQPLASPPVAMNATRDVATTDSTPPIREACVALETAVSVLGNLVQAAEVRLEVVLMPSPNCRPGDGDTTDPARPLVAPLAERLGSLARDVLRYNTQLQGILNRLQV